MDNNLTYHKILNLVELKDLNESMQLVAETCGLEFALLLIDKLGGLELQVPKPQSLEKTVDRYLLKNIAKSPQKLALDIDISESTVRRRIRLLLEEGSDELSKLF